MRSFLFLALFLVPATFLGLPGCGGGGGGLPSGSTGTTAALGSKITGAVQQIDNDTSAVQGVQLRMVETGEVVTSAADGSFAFAPSSPRSFTLALVKTPTFAGLSLDQETGSGSNDTGSNDTGSNDTGSNDSGSNDSGSNDNGSNDNGSNDNGSNDDGSNDNGSNDNGSNDNGSNDDGSNDSGSNDDGDGQDNENGHDGVDDASRDDGDDSTETDVAVHRVENGERVHVRVRVRDGKLDRVDVSRSSHNEREVEIRLRRAVTSDDADIKGKLETESRDDRQRMQVSVERATAGRDLEMFVMAPDGTESSFGIATVDTSGEASLEINTSQGGVLPAGATTVADLEGYDVEVRDATDGTVLLGGKIPGAAQGVPSDSSDGGDGTGHAGRTRGEARLTAVVAGLGGNVEVRSDPDAGRERFKIEAEHLAAYASVEFFVEDSVGTGTFSSVGIRTVNLEADAELELDTGDGASLPNAATSASDLVGLAVEVRDAATGDLLLTGTVPTLTEDR